MSIRWTSLNIPGCTYCNPQVASGRPHRGQGEGGGREINVGRFPFVGNGKAIALGEDQGLIKTIFDADRASCWAPIWWAPR
jgi:dihydrolipoamide dehydrogenase